MPSAQSQFSIRAALTLCLCASLFLTAAAFQQQAPTPKPKNQPNKPKPPRLAAHVVVITISGLSGDLLNKARAETPTLQELQSQGARAITLESVFPALKLSNHASLITGLLPADVGLFADFPFDDQTGLQADQPFASLPARKSETLWDAAQREQLSTATIDVPLTEGAPIDLALTEAKGTSHASDDANRIVQAARAITQHRPNLLLINFASLELAARKYGVGSKEALRSLRLIDAGIAQLLAASVQAGTYEETAWLVLSDRGMAKVERHFNLTELLAQKRFLELGKAANGKAPRAAAQSFGGTAAIFLLPPQDEKAITELEKLFAEEHKRPDSPIWRIFNRRELTKLGGDPRAALYLEAAPGWSFTADSTGHTTSEAADRATSGYVPSKYEMKGALILAGKGIKTGARLEYARMIDIAPTIARLLGFELQMVRGRVLAEALKP